jgi:hypothetical protein
MCDDVVYMTTHKCGCGNEIHPERYNLGYKICLKCGDKSATKQKPYGYLNFAHKTAGAIVITSKKGFDNYTKVSYRKNKGSNMGYASRLTTTF